MTSEPLPESGNRQGLSEILKPRNRSGPVVLTAKPYAAPEWSKLRPFEEEVLVRLAAELPGTRTGETREVILKSERRLDIPPQDTLLRLSRVLEREREKWITVESYKRVAGVGPEKGQLYGKEPDSSYTVEEIRDGQVKLVRRIVAGQRVLTPLGRKGIPRDTRNGLEIRIDVKPGELVRMGDLLGRVMRVTDDIIEVDFSDPFAEETLSCTVSVLSSKPSAGESSSKP
ncbi:MAG: hypothetical protein AB9873_12625 [Syntrophobacteraceae bacterium]